MDRNLREVQQENVRLAQQLAQTQTQFQLLQQQATQVVGQLQQAEQMRIQVACWLIALLLEHHQGEATITIPLIEQLAKVPHGVKTDVQPGGVTVKLTAMDAEGHPVEKPSKLGLEAAAKEGEAAIQPKALEEAPAEPDVVCPQCERKNGAHNLDCLKST